MTNSFKGLDLIDRVPEELWTEIHDTVQEAGIKTIPKEKKCKKAKWLSEKALQIAVKRREVKGKGEKERYIHLNAEFQRIARRNKKAFLSDPHAATAKSLQSCPALCDPMDRAHQAPLSTPFSRQEYWSGLPFPSPYHSIVFLYFLH